MRSRRPAILEILGLLVLVVAGGCSADPREVARPPAPAVSPVPATAPPALVPADEGDDAGVAPPPAPVPVTAVPPAPVAEPEPPPEITVRGLVQAPDGTPVEGAELWVTFTAADGIRSSTASSDAAGEFELQLPGAGALRIAAVEGRWGGGELDSEIDETTPARDRLVVVLEPRLEVAGRVTDAAGVPLPGVTVVATKRRAATTPPGRVVSAEDGSFCVKGLPAGACVVSFDHPDHVRTERPCLAGDPTLEVAMSPAARISGTVASVGGHPVEGATVTAVQPGDAPERVTTSDEAGNFTIAGLARAPCVLRAAHPGFVPGAPRDVDLTRQSVPDLTLTLDRGITVRGRIVSDAGDGIPAADIRVFALRPGTTTPASLASQQAGQDGAFEILGLEEGEEYLLVASAPGHVPGTAGDSRIEVRGGDAGVKLVLTRAAGVSGVVLDPGSAGVQDALVTLHRRGQRPLTMRSAEGGRFAFAEVPPGDWILTATATGLAPALPLQLSLGAGDVHAGAALLLQPLPDGIIAGRLHDPDGQPIAGAEVLFRVHDREGDLERRTESDAGGRFTLDQLEDVRYEITVRARGYEWPGTAESPYLARPGQAVDVALRRLAALRGRVVDTAGAPVTSFTLDLARRGHYELAPDLADLAIADIEGRFEVEFFTSPIDLTQLRVSPSVGGVPTTATVQFTSPYQDLDVGELRVHAGGSLAGRVLDPGGAPVAGARVQLRLPAAGGTAPSLLAGGDSQTTAGDGGFRFSALEPGEYELVARHADYPDAVARATVGGGEATSDIAFTSGGVIRGTVTGAEGAPMPSTRVRAGGRDATTDALGAFEILGVAAGALDVTVVVNTRVGMLAIQRTIEHSGSGVVECDLSVAGTCALFGTLEGLDPPPSPFPFRERLTLRSMGSPDLVTVASTTVGSSGSYRLPGVPPGNYELRFGPCFTTDVTIPAASEHELRIQLPQGRIAGEVVRTDRRRASGASVRVSTRDGDGRAFGADTLADGSGRFMFTNLPHGSYELDVTVFSFGHRRLGGVQIDPEHPSWAGAIEVSGGGVIHLSVVGADGASVPDPAVAVRDARDHLAALEATPDPASLDRWMVQHLPAGSYRVFAGTASAGTAWVDDIQLQDGGEADARIVLPERPGTLRIHTAAPGLAVEVLDPTGRPIADLGASSTRTGEDGMHTTGGLPPGEYRVRVHPPSGTPTERRATVEPGRVVEVEAGD